MWARLGNEGASAFTLREVLSRIVGLVQHHVRGVGRYTEHNN